jgi:transposase
MLILEKLREDVTLTHVANEVNLSIQEVYNIFNSYVNILRHPMPEVLCIDEFKNLKSADGKYAVVIYDPINGIIIDVLESRLLKDLDDYFYHIPYDEKKRVKYLVSDMYEGFRSVKNRHFPNATHVVDSFHYLRYVTDAVNSIRIIIMNRYGEHSKEYRILKRYWNLIVMPINKIKEFDSYNPLRKEKTNSDTIINDCLELSDDLKKAYSLKEDFFIGFETVHYENVHSFINNFKIECINSGLDSFKALENTINSWQKEIENSFIRFGDKRLNNGYLEGMNNRIKVIKKIGYGYKNFYFFRNRLMYSINPSEPLRETDLSQVPKRTKK